MAKPSPETWATVNKNDVFDAIQLAARKHIYRPSAIILRGLPPKTVDAARDFLKEVLNSRLQPAPIRRVS